MSILESVSHYGPSEFSSEESRVIYERVFFAQDDETADEALAILDERGADAAVKFLAQWHYPGEHETVEQPAAGSDDRTHETADGYVLSWNARLGYIGLEYKTEG